MTYATPPPPQPAKLAGHSLDPGTLPMLLTLGLGVFAGALDLGVLSPALPAIALQFGVSARDTALVITLYLLATVAGIPLAGKLADHYGRRPIYIACVAVFALGSILTIGAANFPFFLTGRVIQALGAGGIFPVATATIADRIPQERRGGALGILGAIWGVAGILGPILGGVMTALLSWRWIFIANVPLAALVIILATRHLPLKAPGRRGPLDVMGILVLTIALVAMMLALSHFDPQESTWGGMGTVVVASGVALIGFILLHFIERRAAEPVISSILTGNREIGITYALEVCIGALEGSLFFVPAALTAGQHLSAWLAGLIAALGAVCFVAVIPLSGRALDRYGARAVLGAGSTVTCLGLALFAVSYHEAVLSILAMIIAGSGFGALLGAPTRYLISKEAPEDMRSTAIGLLSIFLIIGQLIGGSLAGGLLGNHALATDHFTMLYLGFAGLGLLTTIGTRFLARRATTAPSL